MSDSASGPSPARPRQVTVAGVMATVACVLLVVGLFDSMSEIRSTETQDSVEDFLSSAPGDRLGLDVDGVVDVLRGVVLFSGALAAAGAILAVYCLRRHRGARIGLSVVAVAMLFSTTFVAGLLPFVVALAASMLWRREARDWFDGREPRPQQTSAVPPVQPPFRSPGQSPHGWPPPAYDPRAAPPPAAGSPHPIGRRRPPPVTAAVWLTWASSAGVLLFVATLVLYLLVDRAPLISVLQRSPRVADLGYTADQLTGALWVIAVLVTVWALAAAAFAALAFIGLRAGQIGVLVCAVLGGVVAAGTFVAPVVALVTVVLLVRRDANRFFDRRSGSPGGPPWQPPDPPDPPPPPPPSSAAPTEQPPPGKPPVW